MAEVVQKEARRGYMILGGIIVGAILIGVIGAFNKDALQSWQQAQEERERGIRTITATKPMCHSYETLNRFYTILVADREGAMKFLTRQAMLGECSETNPGDKIRVEKGGVSSSCIALLGSPEPCQWVSNDAFKD